MDELAALPLLEERVAELEPSTPTCGRRFARGSSSSRRKAYRSSALIGLRRPCSSLSVRPRAVAEYPGDRRGATEDASRLSPSSGRFDICCAGTRTDGGNRPDPADR